MSDKNKHITDYKVYAIVLIGLLLLTFLTITITHIELKAWTVGVALLIACVKATGVLTYFMHLKFDNVLFRILVAAVFILFAIFISITFIDYVYR